MESPTSMSPPDLATELTRRLSVILEGCKRIEPALGGYLKTSDERPDINLELLQILSNALAAYELVMPDLEAGEFHGLPREACSVRENPNFKIRHTEQDADWDFHPWLAEKLNAMQTAAKGLVETWLTNPDLVRIHEDANVTAREWLRNGIALNFGELQQKALTVFEDVCTDRLEIERGR